MGSKSRSWPPSGTFELPFRSRGPLAGPLSLVLGRASSPLELPEIRETAAGLIGELLVADGLGLAEGLSQPLHRLLPSPIGLVVGRVLQRLVGLDDRPPDLVGLHAPPRSDVPGRCTLK